jgi:DNA ligase 1
MAAKPDSLSYHPTMLRFAQTSEAIAATSKKLEKTALVASYLQSLPPDHASAAAIFLSGRPFPAFEESTLQVGGALLWRIIAELSGKSETQLTSIYRRHGDAGSVAAEALAGKSQAAEPDSAGADSAAELMPTLSAGDPRSGADPAISLLDLQQSFSQIAAARGPAAKSAILRTLLSRAMPLEAKYIVKIITGDLRIGLKESLVEEAIARIYSAPLADVKRANMLLGDLGATLRLAAAGQLADAKLRVFHPIDFMLASPVDSAEESVTSFANAAVEDKYDGIRAQAHIGENKVRIFSRTRDDITESFPELVPALSRLSAATRTTAILDGEILAWSSANDSCEAGITARSLESIAGPRPPSTSRPGRALPFSRLQQRLGRKSVSLRIMRDVPIAYLVFDILYAHGEILLDRPLRERAKILDRLLGELETTGTKDSQAEIGDSGVQAESDAPFFTGSQSLFAFAAPDFPKAPVLRAPVSIAQTASDLESLFVGARGRGNEGLMIKDLDSFYTPGRRGKSWLKMKRELATLDVVVTAVEYGHGKRIGVLSDYTFAVWDDDRLVNIGKAYSGLTDAEIAHMTDWFLAHKLSEHGLRLEVEPKIVLEVAFNNLMRSTRHESGYALRFPRIVRLRPDKLPEDADTLATVEQVFSRQQA